MIPGQHSNITDIPLAPPPAYLQRPSQPVGIILDTDMGNDVDDALALALLHALEKRNACKTLAVTLTNPEPQAPMHVSAINNFYKRPDIPIGANPGSPYVRPSNFLKIVDWKHEDGSPVFPHNYETSSPKALALMRRTLAAAPDNSVVIAQIGFFTNNAALLQSPPDEESPLCGRDLIKKKVRFLSVMAGAFAPVQNNNYWLEFNIVYDIPSARLVADQWPTPIVWSGAEVGEEIPFPAHAVDNDFDYTPKHPIKESYQLFRATPHERPTWDLTTTLYAALPWRNYFSTSIQGSVSIQPDGFTRFQPGKGERDRYLILNCEQAAYLRGFFAALCTEQP